MAAADLVFGVGDRIHAWGRFVHDDDGRWLDVSRVVGLSFSHLPSPRSRRYSIPVVGAVDIDAVPDSFDVSGVVPGRVTLTGTWDGSALHVEHQSPVRHADLGPVDRHRTVPPCPEPPSGWPPATNGADDAYRTFDISDLQSTSAAVTVVWFRPESDRAAVLVVAATDPDRVRRVLEPQLPGRLCVVPSTWTRAQLTAAQDKLRTNIDAWAVELFGEDIDDAAQASVIAHPMRVTAELAHWADSLPAGLLTLQPALAPVHEPSP